MTNLRPLNVIFFICIIVQSTLAQAFFFDTSVFYYTDTLTPSGTTSVVTSRNNYDVSVGFSVTKSLSIGWNYTIASTTDTSGGTATVFSSADMGPKFLYEISKDKTWMLGFSYNLSATATYTPAGSTAQTWRGTSMKVELGYMPPMGDTFSMGLKMNYYAPSYTELIVSNTTYSKTTNARTQIYPSIGMLWMF